MPISLQPMPGAAYQMIRYAALPTPIVAYRVAGTAGAACRASAGGIVPEAASTRPSAAHMRTNFPSPKARSAATRVTAREKSPALAASPSSVSVSPSSASAASMGSHTACSTRMMAPTDAASTATPATAVNASVSRQRRLRGQLTAHARRGRIPRHGWCAAAARPRPRRSSGEPGSRARRPGWRARRRSRPSSSRGAWCGSRARRRDA